MSGRTVHERRRVNEKPRGGLRWVNSARRSNGEKIWKFRFGPALSHASPISGNARHSCFSALHTTIPSSVTLTRHDRLNGQGTMYCTSRSIPAVSPVAKCTDWSTLKHVVSAWPFINVTLELMLPSGTLSSEIDVRGVEDEHPPQSPSSLILHAAQPGFELQPPAHRIHPDGNPGQAIPVLRCMLGQVQSDGVAWTFEDRLA